MFERVHASSPDPNRLLQHFIERIGPIIPFDRSSLYLYDPKTDMLTPMVAAGNSHTPPVSPLPEIACNEGVIAQAIAQRRPVRVDDMQAEGHICRIDPAAQSGLAVPVRDDDVLLGVLIVTHRQANIYTAQHETLLQAVADQLAVVIKSTRQNRALLGAHNQLVEQMERHRRELGALQRLAAITSATAEMDAMLTKALIETAEILNCDGALILLPDYEHYELVPHDLSLYGSVQTWPRHTWRLDGPGLAVDVYHTGAVQYDNEPEHSPQIAYKNALFCPLNTRQRTLGVLQLVNRKSGDFTDAHQELGQAIARRNTLPNAAARKCSL